MEAMQSITIFLVMPPGAATATPQARGAMRVPAGRDVDEFLFAQGLSDGFPVVAPTPARVAWMLSGA